MIWLLCYIGIGVVCLLLCYMLEVGYKTRELPFPFLLNVVIVFLWLPIVLMSWYSWHREQEILYWEASHDIGPD